MIDAHCRQNLTKTQVLHGQTPDNLDESIFSATQPVLLKGLIDSWPLVQQGKSAPADAANYLKGHYSGKVAGAYYGDPGIQGRFFYNEDISELNFSVRPTKLDEFLDRILANVNIDNPESLYIASNSINEHFPELRVDNDLQLDHAEFENVHPIISIWIGGKTLVSCHYDALSNIACCAVGKRSFVMFPPDQIDNLYPGPLAPTPGGQVVSMVDFRAPDFDKYPRFKEALKHGQIAELEAGDGLFIPTMWWHQVSALEDFNVLINYWWTRAPEFMGQGMTALLHAILSIRDLSAQEKAAWQHVFDYYVFGDTQKVIEHLPEHAHGPLASIDANNSRQLRAMILNKLNR